MGFKSELEAKPNLHSIFEEVEKDAMEQVKVVHFKETRVAVLEHRGDPQLIDDSVRKFKEWRKENNLSSKTNATFNIFYDDVTTLKVEIKIAVLHPNILRFHISRPFCAVRDTAGQRQILVDYQYPVFLNLCRKLPE